MKRVAVFASGNGSNFQSIVEGEDESYQVALLFSDQPQAYALTRAIELGVECESLSPKDYPDKLAYEADLLALLIRNRIDYIVLAGYMRLIGPTILNHFKRKIVNIHPSLLPDFPGLDAIGQALDAGVEETGVTVHYVDEGMDTGPVIKQEKVLIEKTDTYEDLQKKVQKVEHRLYPETLKELLRKDEVVAEASIN